VFGLTIFSQVLAFSLLAYFVGLSKDDKQLVQMQVRKWLPARQLKEQLP
jgi:hypothetical protein